MKLEPLFDLQDVLYGSNNLTVAYLFETDKNVFDDSCNVNGNIGDMAEITEANDMPQNNCAVDRVDLPFGIGDVFHLQEPFRVYEWNLDSNLFRFEYKDGSVSDPISINNEHTVEFLVGNSYIRKGSCSMNPSSVSDSKEIHRISRWHPSGDMPGEAMRSVKIVQAVTPMRFADVTENMAYSIWHVSRENIMETIRNVHPDFNNRSWILIVELADPQIPHVDLW